MVEPYDVFTYHLLKGLVINLFVSILLSFLTLALIPLSIILIVLYYTILKKYTSNIKIYQSYKSYIASFIEKNKTNEINLVTDTSIKPTESEDIINAV